MTDVWPLINGIATAADLRSFAAEVREACANGEWRHTFNTLDAAYEHADELERDAAELETHETHR